MSVKVARESDGRVSIAVTVGTQSNVVTLSPAEARLIAIKLLLAAEDASSRRAAAVGHR